MVKRKDFQSLILLINGLYSDILLASLLSVIVGVSSDEQNLDILTLFLAVFVSSGCLVYPLYVYFFWWKCQEERAHQTSSKREMKVAKNITELYSSNKNPEYLVTLMKVAPTPANTNTLKIVISP